MRQKLLLSNLLFLIVIFSLSQQAFATELEGSSREEVLTHVQRVFEAQVSLTEEARTQDEIKHILSTYFEGKLIEKYMKENVHELDGQFIVYGTDFPKYTIPFFTYDETTRIIEHGNERIVYEFFPASTEGPVGYEDHYEVVKMRNTNGNWKIYSIKNETKQPEIIVEQTTSKEENNNEKDIVETDVEVQTKDPRAPFYLQNVSSAHVQSSISKQPFEKINNVLFLSAIYIQNPYGLASFLKSE